MDRKELYDFFNCPWPPNPRRGGKLDVLASDCSAQIFGPSVWPESWTRASLLAEHLLKWAVYVEIRKCNKVQVLSNTRIHCSTYIHFFQSKYVRAAHFKVGTALVFISLEKSYVGPVQSQYQLF